MSHRALFRLALALIALGNAVDSTIHGVRDQDWRWLFFGFAAVFVLFMGVCFVAAQRARRLMKADTDRTAQDHKAAD